MEFAAVWCSGARIVCTHEWCQHSHILLTHRIASMQLRQLLVCSCCCVKQHDAAPHCHTKKPYTHTHLTQCYPCPACHHADETGSSTILKLFNTKKVYQPFFMHQGNLRLRATSWHHTCLLRSPCLQLQQPGAAQERCIMAWFAPISVQGCCIMWQPEEVSRVTESTGYCWTKYAMC